MTRFLKLTLIIAGAIIMAGVGRVLWQEMRSAPTSSESWKSDAVVKNCVAPADKPWLCDPVVGKK